MTLSKQTRDKKVERPYTPPVYSFALVHMRRNVVGRVIHMYKCPVYAEAGTFVQNQIDFHVQFVSSVVGLETLDLFDRVGESHREVEQDITLIGSSGSSSQIADMSG
jgi:hypothetical protein